MYEPIDMDVLALPREPEALDNKKAKQVRLGTLDCCAPVSCNHAG